MSTNSAKYDRTSLTVPGFGEREVIHTNWCSAEFTYGTDPFAVFTFKYRSHKDLQIEGILERSPTPPPFEERDPDTLTREELRELLRRRTEKVEELQRVKQEGVKRERATTIIDDDDDDQVVITGEGSSKRRRTSDDSAIEVVDLTDD